MFKWKESHDTELLKLLSKGLTHEAIAKKFRCDVRTVRKHSQRHLGVKPRDVSAVYPIHSIPNRFIKVNPERIRAWIARGWLPEPQKVPSKNKSKRAFYRYTRQQLEAFLEIQDAWMSWKPDDLVEEGLRLWAKEQREKAGWHWVSSKEVAKLLSYGSGSKTIKRWATSWVEWAGSLYVRSDELERMREAIQAHRWHRGTLGYKYGEKAVESGVALVPSQVDFLEERFGNVQDGIRALIDLAMAESNKQRSAAD